MHKNDLNCIRFLWSGASSNKNTYIHTLEKAHCVQWTTWFSLWYRTDRTFCSVHALRLTRIGIEYTNKTTKYTDDLNNSPVNHRRCRCDFHSLGSKIEIYFISFFSIYSNESHWVTDWANEVEKNPQIKACIMLRSSIAIRIA